MNIFEFSVDNSSGLIDVKGKLRDGVFKGMVGELVNLDIFLIVYLLFFMHASLVV